MLAFYLTVLKLLVQIDDHTQWAFRIDESKFLTNMRACVRSLAKWMRKYVGDDIPLFSIIVFSNRCELKKVTVYSEDVKVIKRDWTYAAVRGIWNTKPIQIKQLIEMFIKYLPDDKVIPSVR